MTPKVLKSEAEHAAALARIDQLMDAVAGSTEEQELELWSLLVEHFEEEHFPIARPDPITAIEFRLEQMGLNRSDLLRFIPSKSKISEVLTRKRPLSLTMIRALHAGLNIPAEILLQGSGTPKEKHSGRSGMRRRKSHARRKTAAKRAVAA